MSTPVVRNPDPPSSDVVLAPPELRRHPVIGDANALIQDVLRRTHSSFGILPFLAERKLITLLAPIHIEAKVHLRLPEVATRIGANPDQAMEIWGTVHRRLMRFVDVGDLMRDDPRVSQVALNDPEDVAVAQLGVLLAPSLVLTQDKHLTTVGIGEPQWVDALHVLRELAELERLMYGAAQGAVLAARLTGLAIVEVVRFLRRSELGLGVSLGVAAYSALHMRPQLKSAARRVRTRGWPALERALAGMTDIFDRRDTVGRQLRPTLVQATLGEIPAAAVARVLAERGAPMTVATIHAALAARGSHLTFDQVAQTLRDEPPFELVRGRGWQLGHAASGPVVRAGSY
jgi:hypothetical protein